jgi:hypothetical protein
MSFRKLSVILVAAWIVHEFQIFEDPLVLLLKLLESLFDYDCVFKLDLLNVFGDLPLHYGISLAYLGLSVFQE